MGKRNDDGKFNANELLKKKPIKIWEYRIYPSGSLLENGVVLNDIATFVYKYCDGKNEVEGILNKICEEYDVKKEKAKKDLLILISDLINEDAIKI